MTPSSTGKVPVLFGALAWVALACGSADHPPPIGDGGRTVQRPPVIVEAGGSTANGGTAEQGATGGRSDLFAGSSGDTALGGTISSVAGDTSLGATPSSVAGDTSTGGNGSAAMPGAFSGSFSTGGF